VPQPRPRPHPWTLAVDIGGSGIKTLVLDAKGRRLTERQRTETPQPATPRPVLEAIEAMAATSGAFDRVTVGFPGVVREGIILTAVNLHQRWKGVNLARELERRLAVPVRVANDADIQGYGVIRGRGVELTITLGTGLGSGLFVDGHLVPNLELGHHPFRRGETYEDQLGNAALKQVGARRWNRRLAKAIALLDRIFNYDTLYIGGGNARKVSLDLPPQVQLVSNDAGLLGGIALWTLDRAHHPTLPGARPARRGRRRR
jgi:polyphosphate glucokinase